MGDFNGDSDPDLAVANQASRQRLDPARRRGRELHRADQLRRRLAPQSRSRWATSTATPTPTSRSRTRAPTTSRSCSAPPAAASPGRPASPPARTPARSRWATSTATPTPTSRSRTAPAVRQRLDPARRRGRELHRADQLRRRHRTPTRSRWATSTATPTPTWRSRTGSAPTSRSCSAAAGGSFTGPTNFLAGSSPRLGRGGRLQRRLRPRPRGREHRLRQRLDPARRRGRELRSGDQLRRRHDPHRGRGGRLQRRLRPRPGGREPGLRQRLDPARRRGRELHRADQLRRRREPPLGRGGRLQRRLRPRPRRSRTGSPTTSRSCSAPRAGASPGRPTSASATTPHSVAVGDFNGDSDPDLAVANQDSDNVSILLGAAGGSFTAADQLRAGDGPASVAVGDFNGDSDPDLAVANAASDNVSILLGAAGGSFDAGRPTSAPATGLIRSRWATSTATPTPTSRSRTRSSTPATSRSCSAPRAGASPGRPASPSASFPVSVAVGDFNGDSDPDLAVANECLRATSRSCSAPRAGASLGRPTSVAGSRPDSVAVGDFNGDSAPDLAVANAVLWRCRDPAQHHRHQPSAGMLRGDRRAEHSVPREPQARLLPARQPLSRRGGHRPSDRRFRDASRS